MKLARVMPAIAETCFHLKWNWMTQPLRGATRRRRLRQAGRTLQAAGTARRRSGCRRAGIVFWADRDQPGLLQLAVLRPLSRCAAAGRGGAHPVVPAGWLGEERCRYQAVPRRDG